MDEQLFLRYLQNEHVLSNLRISLCNQFLAEYNFDFDACEICLIRRISRKEGITQSELSNDVLVPAPTVTRRLKRLTDRGLLDRQNDSKDYRKNRLYLTEYGRTVAAIVNQVSEQITNIFFDGFNPEERQQFIDSLERIRQNGEKALKD